MIICATIVITITGVVVWFIMTSSKEISLLIVPFENRESFKNDYSANILMDDITTRLANIHDLRVFKSKEKGEKQIAKELGIDYILEGTVKRVQESDPNSLVRVKSQLIRASDDFLVWEQLYNDVGEVLQISSNLAEKVVQAMDIKLLQAEQGALASMPTVNKEAYIHYLRGNEYSSRPYQDVENSILTIQMYKKAVDLDDKFALAHARLSEAHSGMYWFRHDRSEERLAMAWEESKKALELDPELSEGHWARGVYYYWCQSDYIRALKEFEIARKSQPNNSQVFRFIAYVQRRQGKYEQALINIEKAFELDPLFSSLAMALGSTFRDMRKYSEAEPYYERAISLAPDEDYPYYLKARLYLVWKGRTKEARAVLERASEYTSLADNQRIVNLWFELDVLDKKYEEALARLPLESPSANTLSYSDALRFAQIYRYMGKFELADEYYNKTLSIAETKIKEYPNNPKLNCWLGIAYAGLGRKEDAIQKGKTGLELLRNLNTVRDMAQIYMMVGDFDAAVDQIEHLLSIAEALSIPLLQLDPAWDPLRNHPGFKKLLEPDK